MLVNTEFVLRLMSSRKPHLQTFNFRQGAIDNNENDKRERKMENKEKVFSSNISPNFTPGVDFINWFALLRFTPNF